jgi:hypothetical protein
MNDVFVVEHPDVGTAVFVKGNAPGDRTRVEREERA